MVPGAHPEQSDSPQARSMKKKAVSKIARGKLAKVMVFKGGHASFQRAVMMQLMYDTLGSYREK